MLLKLLILLAWGNFDLIQAREWYKTDPKEDGSLDFDQICSKNGFSFEKHTIQTEDGYILEMWRILGLMTETLEERKKHKPPIFMQHGFIDSGNCFIMNRPEVAPAFVAARAGYDVWLGNQRGNTFSRKHIKWDPTDHKTRNQYWDFDFKTCGTYDMPAAFDHIKEVTGIEKIAFVGFSEGSTMMFYAMATNPEYWEKRVSIFIALGPVTKMTNSSSEAVQLAASLYWILEKTFSLAGIDNIMGTGQIIIKTLMFYSTPLCKIYARLTMTSDYEADAEDRFRVYMDHEPHGASARQLLAHGQNIRENRFQEYLPNYSSGKQSKNIELNKIRVPVAMFVGKSDRISNPLDSEWTRRQLGSAVVHYQEIKGGHLSYMIAKDMTYWTNDAMRLLRQFTPDINHKNSFIKPSDKNSNQ